MALPTQKEMHAPLLKEIEARGGEARPGTELYRAVACHFPQITEVDLKEEISSGTNRWEKYVNYVRLQLVLRGEIDKSVYGVWRITDKGRQRLRQEGLPPKNLEALTEKPFKLIKEAAQKPQPPKRHDELKQKMIEIGKELGYHTSTEEGPVYRHDVLWKRSSYRKDPCHVIEICGGGSLPKDFDALNWARENLAAMGILVTVDEMDYQRAVQRFGNQPSIVVAKAETVDHLHDLIATNLEFLKVIFREHS